MNVNLYVIKEYENETTFRLEQNKPNSNPTCSELVEPISEKPRMDVSLAITRNYNNEQRAMNNELLFKTNPIKPNFKRGTKCPQPEKGWRWFDSQRNSNTEPCRQTVEPKLTVSDLQLWQD